MKTIIVLIIMVSGIAHASEPGVVKAFKSDVAYFASALKEAPGCSFTAVSSSENRRLSVSVEGRGTVEILVKPNDEITASQKLCRDGSFGATYEIADVGTLTLIHEDDGGDSLNISDGKSELDCTIGQ